MSTVTTKSGDPTACAPADLSNQIKTTTFENTKLNVVPLNWKEVYYTNCLLISASNVDQEPGWTREEYKTKLLGVTHIASLPQFYVL